MKTLMLVTLAMAALLTAARLNAADLAADYGRSTHQSEPIHRQHAYLDNSQDCTDLRITYSVPHNPHEEIVRVCGPSIF